MGWDACLMNLVVASYSGLSRIFIKGEGARTTIKPGQVNDNF